MPPEIRAVQADITTLQVDAIVNAAHSSLLGGGVTSIAFPSISTGAYGYPKNQAAKIATTTARNHLPSADESITVIFCCFGPADPANYERLLGQRLRKIV